MSSNIDVEREYKNEFDEVSSKKIEAVVKKVYPKGLQNSIIASEDTYGFPLSRLERSKYRNG